MYDNMSKAIQLKFNGDVPLRNSCTQLMLKERNFSFKKSRKFVVNRNAQWLINERENRCKNYCPVKKLGYKFLYLDESGADENLYPSAGYS